MLHLSGADFIHYNSNFRQYRQYHGTSFARVDHCLHMEAQAKGCHPNFRPSKFSPSPNLRQSSTPISSDLATARSKLKDYKIPFGFCSLFLATMPCTESHCHYKHECPWCGYRHDVEHCQHAEAHLKHSSGNVRNRNKNHAFTPFRGNRQSNQSSPSYHNRCYPHHDYQWQLRETKSPSLSVTNSNVCESSESGPPNVIDLSKSVPPVLNMNEFAAQLSEYDPELCDFLISGLRVGFNLGHQGEHTPVTVPNWKSARDRPVIMRNLLQKEVKKGRILGLFRSPPFPNLPISAIGFVLKKVP